MQNAKDEIRSPKSIEEENKIIRNTLNEMVADLYQQLVAAYQDRKLAETRIKRATTAINALSGFKDSVIPPLVARDLPAQSGQQSIGQAHLQKDSALIKPR